jgi:hypothetical protein
MLGIACPNCGYENRDENRFCTQCGTKLFESVSSDACLHILSEEETTGILHLQQGKNTLGRSSSNSLVVDDELISSFHAMITFENDEVWIEDMESKNGVFVNGIKIEEKTRLLDGYLLRIGATMLRFDAKGKKA